MKEIIKWLKSLHISDEFEDFPQQYHNALSQAIKALQAMEEAGEELPKKREMIEHICLGKHGCRACHIAGGNKAIELIRPLIAKKNMRIKELEEGLDDEVNKHRRNNIKQLEEIRQLRQQNKKLKEDMKKLMKK